MTNDLRACLEGVFGRPVLGVTCRRYPYSTSFPIEELNVELDDGSTLTLLQKNVSWDALLPEAVGTKPEFLHDPLREIEVYRSVLPGAGLGTAACYGSCVEPATYRYWLFIERVDGVELWQVDDFEVWLAVARWLARFHQSGLGEDARLRSRLIEYDRDFYRLWARRAEAFHAHAEPNRRHQLAWVLRTHDEVVEGLLDLATTFIHGELYASNILVNFTRGRRVCPVDWEMAGIGPGLMDVAALASGSWTTDQRVALVRAYHDALVDELSMPTVDDVLTAVDLCRFHLCVRWLGWAEEWSPPAEHNQDWLGEAVELAEFLRS